MNEPIKKVYVVEHEHPHMHAHLFQERASADQMRGIPGTTVREFVEEPRWVTTSSPPGNSREVLILYRPHGPTGTVITRIVALFGSEGKWIALDHDYRREYLNADYVLGWHELPARQLEPMP